MKDQLLNQINQLKAETMARLAGLKSPDDVKALKVEYLGRKGKVTELLKKLGALSNQDRPIVGKEINQLKVHIESELMDRLSSLQKEVEVDKIRKESVDITLPPHVSPVGKIHPLTKVMNELIDVFTGMGFSVYEGPEVETDFYNFGALNYPEDHPARDMQDTIFVDDNRLLRTHTSPVQVRVMQKNRPPIFMIGPGTVYRRDTPDLTHSPVFMQVEGLMVDRRITFGDLKGVLTEFIHKVFGERTKTRFRPSFFPFTEPSAEMEIQCVMCKGSGCRVCKQTGWVEIMGCGMVDPAVFESVKYDPSEVTGFAFGMGVERITMLKYNINDIRLFYENDVRFLEQF